MATPETATEAARFVPPDDSWTGDSAHADLPRPAHSPLQNWLEVTSDSSTLYFEAKSDVSTRPSSDEPPWRSYLAKRLAHFERQSAACGYPAGDALRRTVVLADGLLGSTAPIPNVLPINGGSVRLIWSMSGWYVELDVDAEGADFFIDDLESGASYAGNVDEGRELLRDSIADLTR